MSSVYLIGSLRNPEVPKIGNFLRSLGWDVFDDWYGAGPEADDKWKEYELLKGHSFKEALTGRAAKHVFEFDKSNLDRCDAALLVCPAGKSGHLELGYMVGSGKRSAILIDESQKLPDTWQWIAGVYEGEGSITQNKSGLTLSVSSTDRDVVEKLYKLSGVGRLQGPYFRSEANLKKQPVNIKPIYRWAVYRKNDIQYVIKGVYELLCSRRQKQLRWALAYMEWDVEDFHGPQEFRFDVMYQFAQERYFSIDELGTFKP